MDQLYQETMERYYTIDAMEPNHVSTPNDDAASTSSEINQETRQVDPPEDHRDQLTHGASTGDFLCPCGPPAGTPSPPDPYHPCVPGFLQSLRPSMLFSEAP